MKVRPKDDRRHPGRHNGGGGKIYTRRGDGGETSLLRGIRVPKHDTRVEINGLIDELSSWIGYVRAINRDAAVDHMLCPLQPCLSLLCSDIAAVGVTEKAEKTQRVKRKWTDDLEIGIDRMEKDLAPLSLPVLPGGHPAGASLHLARTVCRRAELLLVLFQDAGGEVNPEALRFLNRMSDFLFILGQWANYRALQGESEDDAGCIAPLNPSSALTDGC